MSNLTPFRQVGSREIYGADISGVQDAVNRVEHVLELGTALAAGHPLVAVEDQASPALHRRIYEGAIRGWLESPAPVVRRGGVIVPIGEYTLYAAQGAVVFHAQQTPGAVITANFTHVTNVSALRGHPALAAPHSGHETPAGAQAKVDAHATRTDNPHAATSAQVGATPAAHLAETNVHGAAVLPTADRIVMRSASGNISAENTLRLHSPRTPVSASAPGEVGEWCWDADFVYVCVAANTWRRVATATW